MGQAGERVLKVTAAGLGLCCSNTEPVSLGKSQKTTVKETTNTTCNLASRARPLFVWTKPAAHGQDLKTRGRDSGCGCLQSELRVCIQGRSWCTAQIWGLSTYSVRGRGWAPLRIPGTKSTDKKGLGLSWVGRGGRKQASASLWTRGEEQTTAQGATLTPGLP